jgi:hypothetical protein
MVARLTAVAVALFMAGAPVITIECEALCAGRVNDSSTTGEHHSCHHEGSQANETAIGSVPHFCGHSDNSPSAVAQSLSPLAAPAVIVVIFTLPPPSVEAASTRLAQDHSPPLIASRSAQLRI